MYISTDEKSDKLFAYQGLGDVWNQDNSRAARQGMFFVPIKLLFKTLIILLRLTEGLVKILRMVL